MPHVQPNRGNGLKLCRVVLSVVRVVIEGFMSRCLRRAIVNWRRRRKTARLPVPIRIRNAPLSPKNPTLLRFSKWWPTGSELG